jgi:phospholipase C
MLRASLTRSLGRVLLGTSVAALALSSSVRAEDDRDHDGRNSVEQIRTASPIKHVIIIVGENRSFDHLFATYRPKSDDEKVLNLLSERIVKEDGSPNENFDRGHQFQITSAPNRSGLDAAGYPERGQLDPAGHHDLDR